MHIGDRGVRTQEQVRDYLRDGPIASYVRHGYGLYAVERQDGELPGICGLVKRVPCRSRISASLSWRRTKARAMRRKRRRRRWIMPAVYRDWANVLAIVTPANARSIRLLEKPGLQFQRNLRLPDDNEELRLFAIRFAAPTIPREPI